MLRAPVQASLINKLSKLRFGVHASSKRTGLQLSRPRRSPSSVASNAEDIGQETLPAVPVLEDSPHTKLCVDCLTEDGQPDIPDLLWMWIPHIRDFLSAGAGLTHGHDTS